MHIQIDPHTLERAQQRGTNADEIRDVIETGFPVPAKYGRQGRAKIYDFGRTRQGIFYSEKRVEVYYVSEGNTIITVTAYVFYGIWEQEDANPL